MKEIIDFLQTNNIEFKQDEPMSRHTSFRIGGNAKVFVTVSDEASLIVLLKYLSTCGIEPLIVGNGSNLLVSDSGVDGVVISLGGDFEKIELIDETTIAAGAGVSLASLCRFALANELTGLEFAYGIPGTLGGAVFMNAGAYGGQMSDVVSRVNHIDLCGSKGELTASELDFGYRKSAYSENKAVITSAVLTLKKGNKDEISARMNELMQKRKDKQPLEFPSAGSVFKRPEGYFAGALIEQSDLKGKAIGGAQVSEKHAGFIVNRGGATCKDVMALIEHCRNVVKQNFGVELETEIKFI